MHSRELSHRPCCLATIVKLEKSGISEKRINQPSTNNEHAKSNGERVSFSNLNLTAMAGRGVKSPQLSFASLKIMTEQTDRIEMSAASLVFCMTTAGSKKVCPGDSINDRQPTTYSTSGCPSLSQSLGNTLFELAVAQNTRLAVRILLVSFILS